MSDLIKSDGIMTDGTPRALAFWVLATPFFLNDFGFIALGGTNGVYCIDYGTRVFVLCLCFAWPLTRSLTLEQLTPRSSILAAVLCIFFLPVMGRLAHHFLEVPFVQVTELQGLFVFHTLSNPTFYWLDLTLGLLLVAISEELVFRKIAMRWLESAGRSPIQIVVISATIFSLIHWGSGPGRLIYTFVSGLFYMIAYLRLRRLWPLVLAHWIENFMVFGPVEF